ncbi:hypothetical protein [Amycolatopsis sp. NPDC004378]
MNYLVVSTGRTDRADPFGSGQVAVSPAEQRAQDAPLMPAPVDDAGASGEDDGSQPGRRRGVPNVLDLGGAPVEPPGAAGADRDLRVVAEVNQFVIASFGTATPAPWRRRRGVLVRRLCGHRVPPGVGTPQSDPRQYRRQSTDEEP